MLRRVFSGFMVGLLFTSSPGLATAQPAPPKFVQKLPQPNWLPATQAKPGAAPKVGAGTSGAPSSLEQVLSAPYLASAVALARPRFHEDVKDWINVAGILVLAWSLAHLRWRDIFVPENETSWGKVAQDPAGEFGKRMCAEGIIRSMVLRKDHGIAYYHGLMYPSHSLDGYYYIALKSNGSLAQGSTTRFCGVVVGVTDGVNGFAMPMTAVAMTGFFDLAINQL